MKVIWGNIRKYDVKNATSHQNRLFGTNQKIMFDKLEGMEKGNDVKPDAKESTTF